MPRRAKPWYRSAEDCWYATVNGSQVSLGIRGRANEAAAWRAWELVRAGGSPGRTGSAAQGGVGVGWGSVQPRPITVTGVIRAFLKDAAGRVQPDTFKLYRLYLTGFTKLHGRLPVAGLTCPIAEGYSRRPTWAASTRAIFLATLARAFRFAERARLIDRTPLLGLQRPPVGSRAADVIISADEHAKLLAVAPPAFRDLLTILHATGCRPGEAAQIATVDVDWAAGTAIIRKHKTAARGKRRVLYLTAGVLELFRTLAVRYPTGPLLRNRIGKTWTRATVGMAMRKAARAAGVPGKVAYGYRHTYATDALAAGVPDAHVAELLGHASTAMLHRHYSHLATRTKVLADAARAVR